MSASCPAVLISIPEGIIDLGWGHPSPRLHPVEVIQQAAMHMFAFAQVAALQYGAEQGYGPLLESLADFLSQQEGYGMRVEPASLFLTGGASQALDMACTLFTQAGDTVVVEEPTYYQVRRIFDDHRLRIVGAPTDASGLCTDALEAMLGDAKVAPPTILYTIPTFHNPTGSVLPPERRRALVELAQRHCFTVIADEVYHLLHYNRPPPPPLATFDTSTSGCVVSLGSFSKILSPGLRLGWIQARPPMIKRFVGAGLVASGGGVNHFVAALVHATIELGLLAQNIATLRETYVERVKAMAAALKALLPQEVSFAVPDGGYYFWLTFPQGVDTEDMLPLAHKAGVSYRPGPAFSTARQFLNALRLSFALYEAHELVQGVERLSHALEAYRASLRRGKGRPL